MVGSQALEYCLCRDDVDRVTIITRRETAVEHPKLTQVLHNDFLDYSPIEEHLKNQDVCIYCIGVYTGQADRQEFRKITVDYTKAFAAALKKNNDEITFCFLSGQGADPSETSRMMFAKDKGTAENLLLNMGFENVHIFRPGYIYPTVPRDEPNFTYKILRPLYKSVLSRLYPNIGVSSKRLATVMVDAGLGTATKTIFENRDIREHNLIA